MIFRFQRLISAAFMNKSEDFFSGLFENRPIKIIGIFMSISINIFLLLGFFGVIWYNKNGSDKKQTVLNMLVSSICIVSIEYFFGGLLPELFRYTFGPLSSGFCLLHSIIKNAIVTQLLLTFDAITVFRYILVFWLRNPGCFNDLFWTFYTSIWIVTFSVGSQLIQHFLPGPKSLNVLMCSGEDPGSPNYLINYVNFATQFLSLIIHTLVPLRISYFKRQERLGKQVSRFRLEPQAIAGFTTNTLIVFVFSLPAAFSIAISKVDPIMLNSYPFYMYVYGLHILSPTLLSFVTLVLFYTKQEHLRLTLKREFFYCTNN
jgi:hypothetical protein